MRRMRALRYLPMLSALIAGVLGWLAGGGQYLVYLLPLAVLNVGLLGSDRIRQARETSGTGEANVIVEGIFLFVLQLVILGLCYLLGFFFANAVPLLSLR